MDTIQDGLTAVKKVYLERQPIDFGCKLGLVRLGLGAVRCIGFQV